MTKQAKQKTVSNISRSAVMYRVVLRHRDTRKPIRIVDLNDKNKAQQLFDELCSSEKYKIVEFQYFDRDLACRTLEEKKV